MNHTSVERAFDTYWSICKSPELDDPIAQCHFDFDRDWRFDRAWVEKLVFVEISGGAWSNGGHVRGSGMMKDYEKHNAATLAGWRGLYCIPNMFEDNPELFFSNVNEILKQPCYAYSAENSMWIARIRNLTKIGDSITHNGITVQREKRNAFLLGLSGKDYRTQAEQYLIDGQKAALNLILNSGVSATPVALQTKPRVTAQVALF